MNGLNANKLMDRMFRKADGVVWDLMTGKIGVQTSEGIATLEGEGDDARININIMDEFAAPLPAFAQSTPIDAVKAGDIIYFGKRDQVSWVLSKTDKGFKVMKPDGTISSWNPPKVSMLGFESGVMVLRSLINMLPNGDKGLGQMQSMLLPMMMLGDGGGLDLEKMMPLMLMSQMNGGDGSSMGNMMQMMLMMKLMGGDLKSGLNLNKPFR